VRAELQKICLATYYYEYMHYITSPLSEIMDKFSWRSIRW